MIDKEKLQVIWDHAELFAQTHREGVQEGQEAMKAHMMKAIPELTLQAYYEGRQSVIYSHINGN